MLRNTDLLKEMLQRRQSGFSLEAGFYHSDDIFDAEMKGIFEYEWVFAGNICEIPRPGDYLTIIVGRNNVIVTRDDDDEVRAFHNTCRHRGSLICLEKRGHANQFVCPYHQWTYDRRGNLVHAGEMPASFDRSKFPLKPVNVEVMEGMMYVCVSDDPPDFQYFKEQVGPYIAPHQPWRCKVAYEETIVEDANWKLVIENNRECYHCACAHPELTYSLTATALPDDPQADAYFSEVMPSKARDWDALGLPHAPAPGGDKFRCIRLPFMNDALSMTLDGGLACRKLLGDLTDKDLGSVRMFHVPGNWNHFASDHIIHFSVVPISPEKTLLTTKWLVHEDAVEGWDYNAENLAAVWQATNHQDSTLARNNHLGTRSVAYQPGPYAEPEFLLVQFTDWYAGMMERYLASTDTCQSSGSAENDYSA